MTRWWLPALLIAALSAAACGDPPDKEMDQAQGAIDAARAAGADRYATAEYAAANDALARARLAVTGRDYRQAGHERQYQYPRPATTAGNGARDDQEDHGLGG